jgi:hypothetical protein
MRWKPNRHHRVHVPVLKDLHDAAEILNRHLKSGWHIELLKTAHRPNDRSDRQHSVQDNRKARLPFIAEARRQPL